MVLPRAALRAVLLLAAVLLALPAQAAAAVPLLVQEGGGGGTDRLRVIFWTLVAVAISMLLLAVGYVYRRAAGMEKPPPVPILEPGQKITQD
jgi:hypothetical protein